MQTNHFVEKGLQFKYEKSTLSSRTFCDSVFFNLNMRYTTTQIYTKHRKYVTQMSYSIEQISSMEAACAIKISFTPESNVKDLVFSDNNA